eukprot:2808087-Amphidinium_carterae.1
MMMKPIAADVVLDIYIHMAGYVSGRRSLAERAVVPRSWSCQSSKNMWRKDWKFSRKAGRPGKKKTLLKASTTTAPGSNPVLAAARGSARP